MNSKLKVPSCCCYFHDQLWLLAACGVAISSDRTARQHSLSGCVTAVSTSCRMARNESSWELHSILAIKTLASSARQLKACRPMYLQVQYASRIGYDGCQEQARSAYISMPRLRREAHFVEHLWFRGATRFRLTNKSVASRRSDWLLITDAT
jgi:hypothetical protein